MRQVFISYARKDFEQAEEIRTALASLEWQAQIALWKDDRSIVAGDDWEQKLWSGLAGSDIVLACVSRHYLASALCRAESEDALQRGVLLVPCLLEPCYVEGLALSARQLAVAGRPLSEVWGDANARATWLRDLVQDVNRALGASAPDLAGVLRAVPVETLHTAFELAGEHAEPDPAEHLLRLLMGEPAHARRIVEQLTRLQPALGPRLAAPPPPRPRIPVRPAATPAVTETRQADRPAAVPMSAWTRYWRTRLDRTRPWKQLVGDVGSAAIGTNDHTYLVTGDPCQEPALLVHRILAHLPGLAGGPRPAVVVVPFPDPDYAATGAMDVQRQVIMKLCDHPDFPGLVPSRAPRELLQEAAHERPLVVVLGEPLRPSAQPQLRALEAFLSSLDRFFGPNESRWPIRLVVVLEEPRQGGLHAPLFRALKRSPIVARAFDPLHFPPWDEVYEQLHGENLFAGLTPPQLEKVEAAYLEAMHDAANLTDLANRLLSTLESFQESR